MGLLETAQTIVIENNRRIYEKDLIIADRDDTIATLRATLGEVMNWISNWDPNFIHDDEWPATDSKARAALNSARGP